MYITKIT